MQDTQILHKDLHNVKPRRDPGGSPLVTTHISHQNGQPSFNLYKFELYSCSLKILRPGGHVISKRGRRREISSSRGLQNVGFDLSLRILNLV